jgi:Bacterial pre-peptidase C-terminal domain/Matrixin
MADRAGNSIGRAKSLNLVNGTASFSDRVSGGDRTDFLKIRLSQRSRVSFQLSQLRSNADLALLNAQGKTIQSSRRSGSQSERFQRTLEAGTYYLRVNQRGNGKTSYQLGIKATLVNGTGGTNELPAGLDLETDNPQSRFRIQFDYRYDTNGWFTNERRAALEAAARVWEQVIQDEFPDTPVGTKTGSFNNPQTGAAVSGYRTDRPIDDLMIFVGARNLEKGSTLAKSQPSGFFSNQTRYTGDNFEPWVGAIAFDDRGSWFFDSTPNTTRDIPENKVDFISVATHEMGHVLGFGLSNAFDRATSSSGFGGSNARAANRGEAIPLEAGRGHIAPNYQPDGIGDSLMSPFFIEGVRKLPTALDLAIFNDIGYSVNYQLASRNEPRNQQSVDVPLPFNERFRRTRAAKLAGSNRRNYRCGCASCLISSRVKEP